MNIDDISRCSSLLQRIEDVNAERARAFSRLTVIFSTLDRLSGKNIVLLNSDAIHKVLKSSWLLIQNCWLLLRNTTR